jgi:hypothetical protein
MEKKKLSEFINQNKKISFFLFIKFLIIIKYGSFYRQLALIYTGSLIKKKNIYV